MLFNFPMLQKILVALLVSFAFGATTMPIEDLPAIDSYSFDWTVCKRGETDLTVNKTQDSTAIWVRSRMESIALSAKDAEGIGKALASVDDYWKRLHGNEKSVSESVDVNKHQVTFTSDPLSGFRVTLSTTDVFQSPVSIDRETAKAFAPLMKKSSELVDLVNRKIQP